jgi:hypothetical protein
MRLQRIAAAQGDRESADALVEQYAPLATQQNTLMSMYAVAGQRERANAIAETIDAAPFGYLTLVRALHTCMCGAPFDLEATPDFAKRIEEAELSWPPVSALDWPLKDW